MCIVRQVKQLDSVRLLSVVLLLKQVNERCGLLKISIIREENRLRTESYIEIIKGLILIADRLTAETSGVGL